MRFAVLISAFLSITLVARADFSYTTTSKTGGTMAAMAGGGANTPSKYYFKGQKMKTESGDIAFIIDFETQKMTTINHKAKTVSVAKLSDLGTKAGDVSKIDVKETGQQKAINGYNAKEVLMTMEMEIPQAPQMGKMQMEMDLWLSSEVPGARRPARLLSKEYGALPLGFHGGLESADAAGHRAVAAQSG